jgi:hypothetical protein
MSDEIQTTEEIETPQLNFVDNDLFLEERRKAIQNYRDEQLKHYFEYPPILPENQNA